ncbi:DUF6538 domain-containing protein [Pseudorhodobacter sp.]|uniref:DUF6538 domain-containing protein n=1 Tax=Pseudorhodobacter sp. TaxID=1934400 RepID=UPI0039E47B80
MSIHLRKDTYYIKRRVPKRFASLGLGAYKWVSLRTDSLKEAEQKAETIWDGIIASWEAAMSGNTDDAEKRYSAALALAAAKGVKFINVGQVADLPTAEFRARMDMAFKAGSATPNILAAEALLGGAKTPTISVSKALELYWRLKRDLTIGKSEDQVRRWENPRKKAVKNFITVVGDLKMADITSDNMLDFRNWWMERLETEDLTANSANKDMIHLCSILKTVNSMKQLKLSLPLNDLSFKEGEKNKRPDFSDEWIKNKLLAPGALDGLNTEARCILLGMINTGYRPSEGAALLPKHICLETDFPHIKIEPDGRHVKSAHAKRIIPLVGISLEALKTVRDGFPRYRDNPSLSATVNSFLRENGLMETPDHTMYSIRHSFEDRMLRARLDNRLRADFMGHSLDRQRYGDGGGLPFKYSELQKIAL